MKDRKVYEFWINPEMTLFQVAVVEVLLDIRELLANPPMEVPGTGSTFSAYGGAVVPCSEMTKHSQEG